jgi:hypothetical protein
MVLRSRRRSETARAASSLTIKHFTIYNPPPLTDRNDKRRRAPEVCLRRKAEVGLDANSANKVENGPLTDESGVLNLSLLRQANPKSKITVHLTSISHRL